jgi:hypothetical protein
VIIYSNLGTIKEMWVVCKNRGIYDFIVGKKYKIHKGCFLKDEFDNLLGFPENKMKELFKPWNHKRKY